MAGDEGWNDPEDEQFALVELLIPAAHTQLEGTFRDSDALDTKALGTLALDAAAIALVIAAHKEINNLWWAPTIGLLAASGLLIAAIWPRRFDAGPDLRDFYETESSSTPLEASQQMLSELLKAIETSLKPRKSTLYWWGLAVFVLALFGCIPVALIRPS